MDLQARVREKWAAKRGSGSTLTSTDDLPDQNSVSLSSKISLGLNQETLFDPSLCTAKVTQERLSTDAASNTVTREISFQDCLPTGNATAKTSHDVSNAQSSVEQCRPKVAQRELHKNISLKPSPEFIDTFECEVFQEKPESAANCGKWQRCKKHPGHHEFIPINDFTLEHLPEPYRNQTYLKGIKSVAKVTVRLRVNYNSTARPQGYLFSHLRGKFLTHTGSGFVYTRLFSEDIKSMEVPDNLMDSGRKDQGLEDHLAATYDGNKDEERFQYLLERMFELSGRDKKSLKSVQKVMKPVMKVARGVKGFFDLLTDYDDSNSSGDDYDDDSDDDRHSSLWAPRETCSLFGLNPVNDLMGTFTDLINKGRGDDFVENPFEFLSHVFKSRQRPTRKCDRDYSRLSRMRKREKVLQKVSSFLGQVSAPSKRSGGRSNYSKGSMNAENVKDSDEDDDDDDFRFSSSDSDYDDDVNYPNIDSDEDDEDDDNAKTNNGGDDTEEDEDDIDDVDFLDELNDCDLKEVENTEEKLNETFGVLSPCCCPECKQSKNPKPKGYYVNVLTARHVVFDKEEARNTVVDLFCDDDSEVGMAKLFGVDVHLYSQAGDLAILMCATHNIRLIWKLRLLLLNMMQKVETMKSESDTPLAVICSHPHGNFKHVTVGEWIERDIFRRRDGQQPLWTSYLYNTPTCPGSSGAPVVILGHKEGTLLLDSMFHPHHGSHNKELNRSSRHISFDTDLQNIGQKARKRLLQEQSEVRRKIRVDMATKWKEEAKMLMTIIKPLEKLDII